VYGGAEQQRSSRLFRRASAGQMEASRKRRKRKMTVGFDKLVTRCDTDFWATAVAKPSG
jgi:hypothetical protein